MIPLRIRLLGYAAAVLLLAGIFALLGYVPPIHDGDGNYLGESFRIFFIHVPAAWTAFLLFFAAFIFAAAYLAGRSAKYDRASAACAEVGWIYATIVILTGPIWAKAAWGVYWSWEPRLVTFLVLWLLYLGYLMLRYSIDDRRLRAIYSSVIAIVAFLEVPVVMFAIKLWNTKLHPEPGVGFFQDPVLQTAIVINVAAFLVTAGYLVSKRLLLKDGDDD